MHPGGFDVLHDSGNEHRFAVADRIDFDLAADEELVDEDWLALRHFCRGCNVHNELGRVLDNLHGAPTENVRGPDENRIADRLGGLYGLLDCEDGGARRLRDAEVL